MSDIQKLQEAYLGMLRAIRALADCPECYEQRTAVVAAAVQVGVHIIAKRREDVPRAATAG